MKTKPVFSVKYEEEKKENCLSSFGAVPVFLEFLKCAGFDRMVSSRLKPGSNQGYHPLQYILTIILINITGGESVSDVETLENDSGLKRFFRKFEGLSGRVFRKGRERVFPSISRVFGFPDRFNSPLEEEERRSTPEGESKILPTSDDFEHLTAVNRDVLTTAQKVSPEKTATLDMDNNLVISSKSNARFSYKKKRSYHPFNVYWHEQDLMVFSEFRDGNVPAGKEQLRILKEAEACLPEGVDKINVRSDTAGYQHKFLEYMESGESRFGRIEFAVSCDVSKSFRSSALRVPEEDWEKVEYTDEDGFKVETGQEIAEVCFVPETGNKSKTAPVFRYFAIRETADIPCERENNGQITFLTSDLAAGKLHLEEMSGKVYKVFGLASNKSGSPVDILLWHRKRCGRSEKEHSRLTGDMAGGRFPSDSFGENAAWWILSVISLNLLKLFQRHALPEKLSRSRIKKLNRLLFRVAVKVVKSGRSLIVRVGKGLALFDLITSARRKIAEIYQRLSKSKALSALF